jgi:hypothetical protein
LSAALGCRQRYFRSAAPKLSSHHLSAPLHPIIAVRNHIDTILLTHSHTIGFKS